MTLMRMMMRVMMIVERDVDQMMVKEIQQRMMMMRM